MADGADINTDSGLKSVSPKERVIIALLFVLFIAMTVVFGVVHRNKITQNAQTLLNSVSFQKSEQIRQWQNRHLVEADEFGHTLETIVSVKALVRNNSKEAGESLLLSFENFAQTYKYSESMVVRPDLSIAVSTSGTDMIVPSRNISGRRPNQDRH